MQCSTPIRIALVEDDREHSRELQRTLTPEHGFQWETICGSAEEALQILPGTRQDILLVDIFLGEMSGIECIWDLRKLQPSVPVIICTSLESEDLVVEAIMAGASGYILKHDAPDLIRTAVRDVAKGCFVLTRPVARDLRQFFQAVEPETDPTARLSPREREVLKEIAQGYMDNEIVEHLNIQMPTLRTYVRCIFEKLRVGTRTEAAGKFWQSREARFHRLSALIEESRQSRRSLG